MARPLAGYRVTVAAGRVEVIVAVIKHMSNGQAVRSTEVFADVVHVFEIVVTLRSDSGHRRAQGIAPFVERFDIRVLVTGQFRCFRKRYTAKQGCRRARFQKRRLRRIQRKVNDRNRFAVGIQLQLAVFRALHADQRNDRVFAVVETAFIFIIFIVAAFPCDRSRAIFAMRASQGQVVTFATLVISGDSAAVFVVIIIFHHAVVERETERRTFIVKPRTRVRNLVVLIAALAAEFPVDIDLVARAAEVVFTEFHDPDKAVRL